MKKFILPLIGVALSAIIFIHCGGDSSSGNISVKGNLSQADYAVMSLNPLGRLWANFVEGLSFGSGTPVTKVWALYTYSNGEFHPTVFNYVKESTPSGGSFSIEVGKNDGSVLVLLNTGASEKKDQVVGYVTMTAGSSGLTGLPLAGATGDLDLGSLTKNGDETSSTTSAASAASTLNLTAEQLTSMAAADDGIKTVKNAYRNYDGSTYLSVKPFHVWYWPSSAASISNTYSSVSTLVGSKYTGYLFYLNSNNSAINYTAICNQSTAMELYPPSSVTNTAGDATFTTSSPITSIGGSASTSSTSCGAGNLYLRDDRAQFGSFQFNFSANNYAGSSNSYLAPPIPSGDWTLKVGSTVLGKFEGDVGEPFFEGDTTKPIVLVPSIKANLSGSTVSSVNVKWYQRNPTTGSYDEVTDTTLLGQMKSGAVSFTDYNVSNTENMVDLVPESGAAHTPTGTFSISSSGLSIAVSYVQNNVSYRFDFRN